MDGRTIAGRYTLNGLLGRGGMGEVWTALDTRIEREVAVKLLPPQPGTDSTELFLREARTVGGLAHPGVVTIHDLGQDDDGTFYLVMERVSGRDLAQVLHEDGPLAIADAVEWTAQIADALTAAHDAQIVHRDLKPANVMLTASGAIKILDFGIARYAATATQASRIIGTPHYMPPERLLGKAGDGRGDLYSLGCLLHELLTGATPFGDLDTAALMFAHVQREPAPPSARRSEVPAALDRLVLDLLAKDPDDRPAAAAKVRDRLRALGSAPAAATAPAAEVAPESTAHPLTVIDVVSIDPSAEDGAPSVPVEPATTPPVHSAPTEASPSRPGRPAVAEPTPAPVPAPAPAPQPYRQARTSPAQAATSDQASVPAPRPGWLAPSPSRRGFLLMGGLGAAALTGGTTYGLGLWHQDKPRSGTGAKTSRTPAPGTEAKAPATPTASTKAETPRTPGPWSVEGDSAILDGGVVYATDGAGLNVFDAATGTLKWKTRISGGTFRVDAVDDRMVYVSSAEKVHAIDVRTHKRRWTVDLGSDLYGNNPVAVSQGLICYNDGQYTVQVVDTEKGRRGKSIDVASAFSVKCDNGRVLVPDDEVLRTYGPSGQKIWEARTSVGDPTIIDHEIYTIRDSGLHALDTATGDQKWSFSKPYLSYVAGASGHLLFVSGVSADGESVVHALNSRTHHVVWTRTYAENISYGCTVDDTAYFYAYQDSVSAFDLATGKNWTSKVKHVESILAASDSYIYAIADRKIHILDSRTGHADVKKPLPAPDSSIVSHGTLYFAHGDIIEAFDLATAKTKWKVPLDDGGNIVGVGSGRVVVTGYDNRIHALDTATGTASDH